MSVDSGGVFVDNLVALWLTICPELVDDEIFTFV